MEDARSDSDDDTLSSTNESLELPEEKVQNGKCAGISASGSGNAVALAAESKKSVWTRFSRPKKSKIARMGFKKMKSWTEFCIFVCCLLSWATAVRENLVLPWWLNLDKNTAFLRETTNHGP